MPILKALIEMENTGYIPFKIRPVAGKDADSIRISLLTELNFIAACGHLADPPDAMVAVAAISPFPVSKTDYSRACAAARERIAKIIPNGAICDEIYPIALRTFPFLTDEDSPRKRYGDPADRPLQWTQEAKVQ